MLKTDKYFKLVILPESTEYFFKTGSELFNFRELNFNPGVEWCWYPPGGKKMVEKRNMMSGQVYMEEEGTPGCLSPASETYWSI